jgi:Uma2 family endonuclease
MGTQTKVWTEAELMALPRDGHKYELVNGELQMSPAGSFGHGDLILVLAARLVPFVKANKLGVVFDGQTGFWMKSGNMRSPDLSFLGKERLKALNLQPHTFVPGAPDLAVEFLSPSERESEVAAKAGDYFGSGCRLLWIVNAAEKTARIYHSATPDKLLKSGDSFDGENVVPGFAMPLDELFAETRFE